MKRPDRPPDYLIDAIARHVGVLLKMRTTIPREANAQRLLRKEVKKLLTYKTPSKMGSNNSESGT